MSEATLLHTSDLRDRIAAYFEPVAPAIDAGQRRVHDGLAFLHQEILPAAGPANCPNERLDVVASTLATVAWSDTSSAFSLWCHRMVLEYLSVADGASPVAAEWLPRLLRTEVLGTTALAAAMAHFLTGAPLATTVRREADTLVLNGRVSWASNLFTPNFLMVVAATDAAGEPLIVAVPGGTAGIRVDPYPDLLALQATASSSLLLDEVRVSTANIITTDFQRFVRRIRPVFLLMQSSFCWGLARRSLDEASQRLSGVNSVLQPDYDHLEGESIRLAGEIRGHLAARGQSAPLVDFARIRLAAAQLTTGAVALEMKALGGRAYVRSSGAARRFREAAFLPIQAPTEGQLRWELSHFA